MHVFGYEPREGERVFGPPVRAPCARARLRSTHHDALVC